MEAQSGKFQYSFDNNRSSSRPEKHDPAMAKVVCGYDFKKKKKSIGSQ